ncbi:MAG: hypothetical protein HC902_00980 [Calothrix sp. SM1_5_4]|nr:hypothetical protein [Calothrix sp. SM1_5_4]
MKFAWSGPVKSDNYFHTLEMPHLLTTVEIRTTGMNLVPQDHTGVGNDLKSIEERKEEYEQVKSTVYDLAETTFNFESPDSMRQALFFGPPKIKPLGRGKRSGKYVLDKKTLSDILCEQEKLSHKNCKLLAYILYGKQIATSISKHEEIYGNVNKETGKIQPDIAPLTTSGRYWSRSPNVLSLSSTSEIKAHIIPSPDNAFVIADFSQIDLRVIANETALVNPKSKMLADVNSGIDLHLNTLKIVDTRVGSNWKKIKKDDDGNPTGVMLLDNSVISCGPSLSKELLDKLIKARHTLAKPINFGVSYGLGPEKLMENLNETDEFREQILKLPKGGISTQHADKKTVLEEHIWIDEIRRQIKSGHHTLEAVAGYLELFHATYPDIKKFQSDVEEELRTKGYCYNIFGRKCRAELLLHMESTELDLKIAEDEWYRVKVKTLRRSKKYASCLLLQAHELKATKPVRKRFPKISDYNFEQGREIYQLNLDKLSNVWSGVQQGSSADLVIDGLLELHESSGWDSGRLFDVLTPIAPIHPELNEEIVDRPLFPFCGIRDSFIRRVRVSKDNFVEYPGYDKLRRKIISQRVSSTSMDVCKVAMIELRRHFKNNWPNQSERPKIINCIHDEIAVECRTTDADRVKAIMGKIMQDPSNYEPYLAILGTLLVKIEADIKSGENYSKAKP